MNNSLSSPLTFLLSWASETPDGFAVHLNGKDYSYDGLLQNVRKRADFLASNNISKGTKCAVYTDNEEEFFFTIFALWMLGAILIPINTTQKTDKLKQIEKTVEPDIGLYSDDYNIKYERTFPMVLFSNGEPTKLEEPPFSSEDIAIIMFTSGTSGIPKAVPLSHSAIAENSAGTARRIGIKKSDKLLINAPPYTTSSIIHLLSMMSEGGATVIDRRFLFGSSILDHIEEHQCSGFGGVPVHFSRLLAALEENKAPECLKFMVNSGEHLPVPILEEIIKYIPGIKFHCIYGLTEVAGRLCILPYTEVSNKAGSVGYPLDGMTITIRNPKGGLLKPGQLGQVFIQGPNLMSGYLNNNDANKKSMTEYGFASGDYGYLDEEGYLFIKGREDDIFKVGGEKVSTKMIEQEISSEKTFLEFMVIPEYSEHLGNIPCLYYVLKEGAEFKSKQILSNLRKKLPPTHIPAKFIEIDKLPRTSSGKIIRKNPDLSH